MDLNYLKIGTPIHPLKYTDGKNKYYIKRDDLLPFSFGGNKVRIALKYFEDMEKKGGNCMITYGNTRSNLCRVVANLCASKNIPCYIISPADDSGIRVETNNSRMVTIMGAHVIPCLKSNVADTLSTVLQQCKNEGLHPYYTNGNIWGNGNEKTPIAAYVEAYQEIIEYERQSGITFDYIFHASGTGMTQAGLICGSILNHDHKNIIGISVSRSADICFQVITRYVNEYLGQHPLNYSVNIEDQYLAGGYGQSNREIDQLISKVLLMEGIALDSTYTGKAFYGMIKYCMQRLNNDQKNNILFLHTGGTPIFFDNVMAK